MLELDKIYNMDCIEGMKQIDDNSIDLILCDLPYGITQCKWDKPLPLDKLWIEYKRIIKNNTAIILTAVQPYATDLINSNKDWFRYEWIWIKNRATNFLLQKKQPGCSHEYILIFFKKMGTYNPQKNILDEYTKKRFNRKFQQLKNCKPSGQYKPIKQLKYKNRNYSLPKSILFFNLEQNNQFKTQVFHPTQKPLKLFEYLIKTYSNDGNLVLDNCIGSGTTAVACKRLN